MMFAGSATEGCLGEHQTSAPVANDSPSFRAGSMPPGPARRTPSPWNGQFKFTLDHFINFFLRVEVLMNL
jgi:hypothetical protein